MKYFLISLITAFSISVSAQVKVTTGTNSSPFKLSTNQTWFTSFNTDNENYYLIRWQETFNNVYTVITSDKSGMITSNREVFLPMSMSNNTFDITDVLVVGKTPYVFVSNHNKSDLKNTLTARLIDNKGAVVPGGTPIASFPIAKMNEAGDWYTSLTPDKKHVAVVWKPAHQKDKPDNFTCFLLDENLKEISKRQFSFPGYTKDILPGSFYSSNKGDLYFLNFEFDKTYTYPVVFSAPADGTPLVIPVTITDPTLRSLSYTGKLNSAGELIIGGYTQLKKTISVGDQLASGTWLFNSSKPSEIKTFKFDKPVTNLVARDIIFNGDTFFIIGEQYLAEKQNTSVSTTNYMKGIQDNFIHLHDNIMVTGFSVDGEKKFEMPISRKWKSKLNLDQDMQIATGIINNKLALIYNDSYSKYINEKYMETVRLPVAVLITNDGLMEAPVNFAKELDVKVSSYLMYPQFFSTGDGSISILSVNPQAVKAAVFK